MNSIKQFKKRFDKKLDSYFQGKRKVLRREIQDHVILASFEQAMDIALHGGKRIRPYLAWLMFTSCGGKNQRRLWDVLIGIELFHAFALIHDDIMDKGELRHGLLAVHTSIEKQLKKEKRLSDAAHIATSQAILVGDLFYAWATECIAKSPTSVLNVYFEMNQEVMLGQMLDVDGMSRQRISKEQLFAKTSMKTAGYTFVQPLKMGWALAGSPKSLSSFPESFGRSLGIAFQIQDDYLDLTGTVQQLGKQPLSDIRDGQHTYFTQALMDQGTKKQQNEFLALFRTTVNQREAQKLQDIFSESGAFEQGLKQMNFYFQKARQALERAALTNRDKKVFLELYETICARTH